MVPGWKDGVNVNATLTSAHLRIVTIANPLILCQAWPFRKRLKERGNTQDSGVAGSEMDAEVLEMLPLIPFLSAVASRAGDLGEGPGCAGRKTMKSGEARDGRLRTGIL
jgi:hypothetical protein